jgi:hypothetical protein
MKNVILDLFLATETAARTIELPITVTISKNDDIKYIIPDAFYFAYAYYRSSYWHDSGITFIRYA